MNGSLMPERNPPREPRPNAILFLLVAFVPLPVGLLIGPTQFAGDIITGKLGNVLMVFSVAAVICCMIGSIGMVGGYRKGAWQQRILGIVVGIILWTVEMSAVAFIGCCEGLSHI